MPTPHDQLRRDNEKALGFILGLVGAGQKYKDLKAFVCSDAAQSVFPKTGRAGRIFLHQLAVLDSAASVGEQDNARRILTNRYTLGDFHRVIHALGGRGVSPSLSEAKKSRPPVVQPKAIRIVAHKKTDSTSLSGVFPKPAPVGPQKPPHTGKEKKAARLDANKLCVRAAWLVAAYVFFSSLGLQFDAAQRPEPRGVSSRTAPVSCAVP